MAQGSGEVKGKKGQENFSAPKKAEKLSNIVEHSSDVLEKNLNRIAQSFGQFQESAEADIATLSKIDHTNPRRALDKDYKEITTRVKENIDTLNSLIRLLSHSADQRANNTALQLQSMLDMIKDSRDGDEYRKMNGLESAETLVENLIQDATTMRSPDQIPPQIATTFAEQPDIAPMFHAISMDIDAAARTLADYDEFTGSENTTLDALMNQSQARLTELGKEPYSQSDLEAVATQLKALVFISQETGIFKGLVDKQIFPMLEKALRFDTVTQTYQKLQNAGGEFLPLAQSLSELFVPSKPELAAEMVNGWRMPSPAERGVVTASAQELRGKLLSRKAELDADLKKFRLVDLNKGRKLDELKAINEKVALTDELIAFIDNLDKQSGLFALAKPVIERQREKPREPVYLKPVEEPVTETKPLSKRQQKKANAAARAAAAKNS